MTLFAEIKETLDRWPGELAERLDVNPRRVRAWAAGEEPVPEGVWRELYEMLRQNSIENARLQALVMKELYPDA